MNPRMKHSLILACYFLLVAFACNPQGTETNGHSANDMDTTQHKHTNRLINESSPYLLQHAHNPVQWYPWGEEALQKAADEEKLILVSIGYSACHWCHVMERESFEDEEVAAYMNDNFVCIKVDREERPDVDQIYMNAVQLITGGGGWPLNCFALPDGKPFYGGTYFQRNQWMQLMARVQNEWDSNRTEVLGYANRLTEGVQTSELIQMNTAPAAFSPDIAAKAVRSWEREFDHEEGGPNRAPKFPLPNNYQYLLRQAVLTNDDRLKEHVLLTLDKMAFGGIYDQLGGGFARYSTDELWKVPHFEKMLYDNGQLVSLYAEAYQATQDPLYKKVVYETLDFVDRELTDETGAFYSALDADSEGEEGKFYVWTKEELQTALGDDFALFADYYNVNNKGFWEHGNYILLRDKPTERIAKQHDMTLEAVEEAMAKARKTLMNIRDSRVRPGLDDKSLTSWNALMTSGYIDAYFAFGEKRFLETALTNAKFLTETQRREDGGLNHSYKNGRSTINGYLEDYCFTIEALIKMYQATFDRKWIEEARKLADYTIAHFSDQQNGLLFFTSDLDQALIARKSEVLDNVIPASNSSMAKGLNYLGHYFDEEAYLKQSETMLNNVVDMVEKYPSSTSNWLILLQHFTHPFYEIAITGKDALDKRTQLDQHYIPNKLVIGSKKDSDLPLLAYKYVEGETMIYVCLNKVCKLPVTEVDEAIKQLD